MITRIIFGNEYISLSSSLCSLLHSPVTSSPNYYKRIKIVSECSSAMYIGQEIGCVLIQVQGAGVHTVANRKLRVLVGKRTPVNL
jgi:hypothetical protein